MTLRELQEQALRLSSEDRWELINVLMRSLQPPSQSMIKSKGLAVGLIGIAKTDVHPPTVDCLLVVQANARGEP